MDVEVAIRLDDDGAVRFHHERAPLAVRLAAVLAVADQLHGLAEVALQQRVAAVDPQVIRVGDELGRVRRAGLPAEEDRVRVQRLTHVRHAQSVAAFGELHRAHLAHHPEVLRVDRQLQVLPRGPGSGGLRGDRAPATHTPADAHRYERQQSDYYQLPPHGSPPW